MKGIEDNLITFHYKRKGIEWKKESESYWVSLLLSCSLILLERIKIMEKVQFFKCSDGTVYDDRKSAIDHETSIKIADNLTAFVDAHYSKGMTKDQFTAIISDNLTTLSEMRESARPKRKRRTKAELEADMAKEEADKNKPIPKKKKK